RGIVVHVRRLDAATRRVAAGDLAVRVPESGPDELAGLARAFNRMLDEVEASRARIEYLQRIAAWQELARRLAHEIKNPLTPIQLAVQEVHRRYRGDDPAYRDLLRETLEMVEAEVRTLHRLVTEFSDFARLPHPALKEGDLAAFLREQQERLQWIAAGGDQAAATTRVTVAVEAPGTPAPASFDAEMLGRALLNLALNARQAMELAGRASGRITLTLQRDLDHLQLDVDDDGPGIPEDLRDTVFDPYVTTKAAGTGLGLAIVKKIVIEHGGTIVILTSPDGGARVRLRLPAAGTAAAIAASEWRPPPPSRPHHVRPLEPDA
ncbi:MAG TPA: ATP-binding protein, partial [Polyangiaceae bacterium]|nr:ATP-binding protein [Polyangiaceae bacterium]